MQAFSLRIVHTSPRRFYVLLQRMVRHVDRLQSRYKLVGVVTFSFHHAALDTPGNVHSSNEDRGSFSPMGTGVQRPRRSRTHGPRSIVSVLPFPPQPLPIHISCYPLAMRIWWGAHPIHIHYNDKEKTHHYLPHRA